MENRILIFDIFKPQDQSMTIYSKSGNSIMILRNVNIFEFITFVNALKVHVTYRRELTNFQTVSKRYNALNQISSSNKFSLGCTLLLFNLVKIH